MKKEIEQYEYIIKYLNGQLEGSQIDDFQIQLAQDADFAIAFENVKKGHDVITERSLVNLRKELKSIHIRQQKFDYFKKWAGGIGLSCLVITSIIFWGVKNNQDSQPFKQTNSQLQSVENNSNDTIIAHQNKIISSAESKSMMANKKSSPNSHSNSILKSDNLQSNDTLKPLNNKSSIGLPDILENTNKTEAKNTTQPENSKKTQSIKKIDCKKVKITAQLSGTNIAEYKPHGKIVIEPNSIAGGTPPYSFSINKVLFTDSFAITGLYPGNYSVYARDANNCLSKLGFIRIESVNNTYQHAFAPLKGEIWTIPLKQEGKGIVKIFTKSGIQVFSANINPGDILTWNGETLTGQQLPMGLYMFQIDYTDGTNFIGNITIIK